MAKKSVKITETVLRDGQQSLAATRMRIVDMLPILEKMDSIGYHPMADDVVREFIMRSVDNGVSIIRIFDALNDTRNLETAMRATKEAGAHAQGCIVYTVSPYHKDEDFVKLGKELVEMGADSICIKDMAGLLLPYNAYKLIQALKKEIHIPIELHTHFTSALGDMTYLKAIEAGVDIIDTAISPFSCASSQPCTESIVAALKGTDYDTGLDLERLGEVADYFKRVKKDLEEDFHLNTNISIDPKILSSQIPGGMLSNLLNQMKEMGVADEYDALLSEMPRVRKELGYPPLVTPTSQIVGTMAVMNVVLGRYKMIPQEVRNLVAGKYGRTPGPIDPEVKRLAIGNQEPITCRPADMIPPQLDTYRKRLAEDGYPNASMEDLLSYISFPEVAKTFFGHNR